MGKWHLGYTAIQSPSAHGFGYFFGLKSGYHDYWHHNDSRGAPDLWENDTPVTREGYSTTLIADHAIAFITEQARTRTPFFIDIAFNAPHWPFQGPETPSKAVGNARFLKPTDSVTSTRADYVRMVEALDAQVGRVLAALDQQGLAQNTLVLFTNDNGGEWLSDNTPLFHRKWTTWEGGIRVPTMLRWPGRVRGGTVSPQVGITMDLTATILAATGATPALEAPPDGIDLMPILDGRSPTVARTLFWRSVQPRREMRAVRDGDRKLVLEGNHALLFDVRRDPGERHDLARSTPGEVRRLKQQLDAWERAVDAEAARRRVQR